MQRWLNTVCGNDVLMRDDEMIFFVESDFGYSPVVRMKQPATGVRRRVIKQFAPPPDDTPELHEARPVVKLFYLGTMETGQKMDKMVRARRGMAVIYLSVLRYANIDQDSVLQNRTSALSSMPCTFKKRILAWRTRTANWGR